MTGREMKTYVVFGFATTHDALSAEQVLKDLGVDAAPIPPPKALGGALCGIALRIPTPEVSRAQEILDRAGIKPVGHVEVEDV